MEATRGHLNPQDVEVGYADIGNSTTRKHAAPHQAPPMWLQNWEDRRPRLFSECFAEMLGVYIYTLCGVGATAAFFITTVGKEAGFGSLLTIGMSYGIGIILAIVIAGPVSGGHLSPCYTIAFYLYKGFPLRKVPLYIIAQILGGFLGILSVYGVYHQQLNAITEEFMAVPALAATIYTPSGPAGTLALFVNPGQLLRYVFVNEFIANIILSIAVFSVLDASNLFVSFASAPFLIAIGYMVMIWAFAPDSLALNTARDLGGRFACAAAGFEAKKCFPPGYTALACLTNILATQIGAAIQILILSDTARPINNLPPSAEGPSLRSISRGDGSGGSLRVISRDNNTLMEKNGRH